MNNPVILAILGSSAFAAFITNIFALYRDHRTHNDGIAKGVQLLLYRGIKTDAKHYIAVGQVSAEELEDLTSAWECYHNDLGGNGYLDSLMAAVKRLPIV